MKKITKVYVVDVLIIAGLFNLLKQFWDMLEITFDGGTQPSISDTVIATILVTILWLHIRKWII